MVPASQGCRDGEGASVVQVRHAKDRLFFLLYILLLLFALVWARFEYVARHSSAQAGTLQLIIIVGLVYVAVRAVVVMRASPPGYMSWVWLSLDLVIITLIVWLTGGVRSEAGLAYVIPVVTGAVEFRSRRVVAAGVAGGLLYVMACWPLATTPEWEWMVARLVFLGVLTTLATWYAISERRRVDELTRLREQVVLADYRAQLSQELHDGVQHYLVAAVCRLELASKVGEKDPQQGLQMALGVRHTIRQAADELRYLVRRLRSPKLERDGFVEALREHLELYAGHVPFSINVQISADRVDMSPEAEQVALRIVQEALTNAEKHAQPTEVRVTLSLTAEALQAIIQDDGAGFDVSSVREDVRSGEGLGLAGMRHRAESVGGNLELHSQPGQGCTLSFQIPLK